jgi:hypothetical protein
MKLIKFIAAAVLVVSTSLVSGGQSPSSAGVKQDVARVCPNWPHCREVEIIGENTTKLQVKTEVVRKAA